MLRRCGRVPRRWDGIEAKWMTTVASFRDEKDRLLKENIWAEGFKINFLRFLRFWRSLVTDPAPPRISHGKFSPTSLRFEIRTLSPAFVRSDDMEADRGRVGTPQSISSAFSGETSCRESWNVLAARFPIANISCVSPSHSC